MRGERETGRLKEREIDYEKGLQRGRKGESKT
jgi:hypothetical protein